MFTRTTFADLVRAALRESNDCHTPAGSPAGGQFCSKGGSGETLAQRAARTGRSEGELRREEERHRREDVRARMARNAATIPQLYQPGPSGFRDRQAAQYGGKAKTLPEPDLSWTKAVRQNFEDKKWAGENAQAEAVGGWGRLAELRKTGVTVRAADLPALKQAAEDWLSGRASRNRAGTGWRVRTQRSDVPTSRYGGRATVPTWSKVVTRYFGNKDTTAFHRFAHAGSQPRKEKTHPLQPHWP